MHVSAGNLLFVSSLIRVVLDAKASFGWRNVWKHLSPVHLVELTHLLLQFFCVQKPTPGTPFPLGLRISFAA